MISVTVRHNLESSHVHFKSVKEYFTHDVIILLSLFLERWFLFLRKIRQQIKPKSLKGLISYTYISFTSDLLTVDFINVFILVWIRNVSLIIHFHKFLWTFSQKKIQYSFWYKNIMIIWFFCHLDYWRGYLYTEINFINSEEKTSFQYSDLYFK